MLRRVFPRFRRLFSGGLQPEMGFKVRAPWPVSRGRGVRGDLLARQPIPGRLAIRRPFPKSGEILTSGFRKQFPESINNVAASRFTTLLLAATYGLPAGSLSAGAEVSGAMCSAIGRFRVYRRICDLPRKDFLEFGTPEIRILGVGNSGAPLVFISPPPVSWEGGGHRPGTRSELLEPRRALRGRRPGGDLHASRPISSRPACPRFPPEDREIWRFRFRNSEFGICKRLRGAAFFDVAVGRFR